MSHQTTYRKLIAVPSGNGYPLYEPPVSVCRHVLEGGNMLVVESEHQGEVSECFDFICEWCDARSNCGHCIDLFEIPLSAFRSRVAFKDQEFQAIMDGIMGSDAASSKQ